VRVKLPVFIKARIVHGAPKDLGRDPRGFKEIEDVARRWLQSYALRNGRLYRFSARSRTVVRHTRMDVLSVRCSTLAHNVEQELDGVYMI
jgi:hypothetical protein